MYLIIRLKGTVGTNKKDDEILKRLKLTKRFSFRLLPESFVGTIKRIEHYVTWGEVSPEVEQKLKNKKRLAPPRKGLKSIKKFYPKGDLGYRGDKINEFAMRMMPHDVQKKS